MAKQNNYPGGNFRLNYVVIGAIRDPTSVRFSPPGYRVREFSVCFDRRLSGFSRYRAWILSGGLYTAAGIKLRQLVFGEPYYFGLSVDEKGRVLVSAKYYRTELTLACADIDVDADVNIANSQGTSWRGEELIYLEHCANDLIVVAVRILSARCQLLSGLAWRRLRLRTALRFVLRKLGHKKFGYESSN